MKKALTLLYMIKEQKCFRATEASGQSPDLPPSGALLQLAQGMSIHYSIHLHKGRGAIFFSFFGFLQLLINLKKETPAVWSPDCWESMIVLLILFKWVNGYIGLAQVFCLNC